MFRYIKEGRVSATLSHSGEKQIEITELLRAFGALQPETVTRDTARDSLRQSQSDNATPATVTYQIELERLKAQLELKTSELDLAKERISELKSREHESAAEKNRLLTLIEQQSRLLTAPVPPKPIRIPPAAMKQSTLPKSTAKKTKVAAKKIVASKPVESPKKKDVKSTKKTSKKTK